MILSKLQLPNPGKEIVNRDRLLSKVKDFKERKVTYVIAPAGYGKTVFIRQFIDSAKTTFLWYQIDSFDNDPVQFFQYLISGLSAVIPDFHVNIPVFSPENIKSDTKYYDIMSAIISELGSRADKGIIIVFDDFHLISDPEILKFMEYFLNYLPKSAHIVISCRYKPVLKLQRLKAGENVIELNQQDLEFSQIETEAGFP
jgi:LuxR family maltose regulon positive regulatory protein